MTRDGMDQEIEAALRGDDWLRRLARHLARDAHDADDLVQDAWAAALERDGAPRSLRAWLDGVVRNGARRLRRDLAIRPRSRPLDAAAELSADSSPDSDAAADEARAALAEALTSLPADQRAAIHLVYLGGQSLAAAASRLGVAPSTVHRNLHLGLETLRRRLDRRFGGDRAAWAAPLLAPVEPPAGARIHRGEGVGAPGLVVASTATLAAVFVSVVATVATPTRPGGSAGSWTGEASPGEELSGVTGIAPARVPVARVEGPPTSDGAGETAGPAAAAGALVRGRVVTTAGAPVSGARVTLLRPARLRDGPDSAIFPHEGVDTSSLRASRIRVRHVETRADGAFDLEAPAGEPVLVAVERSVHDVAVLELGELVAGDAPIDDVVLAPAARISGRVVFPPDVRAEDHVVLAVTEVQKRILRHHGSVPLDAQGRFEVAGLPAGEVELHLGPADPFASFGFRGDDVLGTLRFGSVSLAAGEVREAAFSSGGAALARIEVSVSAEGAEEVGVQLDPVEAFVHAVVLPVEDGVAGPFLVRPGRARVAVRGEGWVAAPVAALDLEGGESRLVELAPGIVEREVVVEAEGGLPADAAVVVDTGGAGFERAARFGCGPGGRTTIRTAAGDVRLTLVAPGAQRRSVVVAWPIAGGVLRFGP